MITTDDLFTEFLYNKCVLINDDLLFTLSLYMFFSLKDLFCFYSIFICIINFIFLIIVLALFFHLSTSDDYEPIVIQFI